MYLCLRLDKFKYISHEEFERSDWLPLTYRFKQCAISIVFKYFNEQCANYLNEVFDCATERNVQLRNSFQNNVHFERLIMVSMLCLILVQFLGTKPLTHSSIVTILIPSNLILKNIP